MSQRWGGGAQQLPPIVQPVIWGAVYKLLRGQLCTGAIRLIIHWLQFGNSVRYGPKLPEG